MYLQQRLSNKEIEIGYWRKANAVHQWFVNNVQNGEDDCGSYDVSREQLQDLLDIVNELLSKIKLKSGVIQNGSRLSDKGWEPILEKGKTIINPEVCGELLPTTNGYFFGSTDYDEYYYRDLKDTKKILTKALKSKGDNFFYYASW